LTGFFSVALLTATLRSAAPLVFAAMGGLLSERSGITNIALEGFMLMGAFAAVAGTWFSGNPLVGLLVAILTGGIGGLIFAYWSVTLKADQIVAGTAIVLLGLGLTSFLTEQIWGQAGGSPPVQRLPTIGAGLNVLLPVAFLLVPITHWFLFKTKPGLRVLACGENPVAAQSVGINVAIYRYAMVIVSGVLAALGGAYLSIGDLSQFSTNMTAGRGFIALAAVIFGNWMPWATMGAALLFGFAQALRYHVQALDLPISQDVIIALPYILTLIAVTGLFRQSTPPAGLGRHPTGQ
jgi:simple sugar transport system permease protein